MKTKLKLALSLFLFTLTVQAERVTFAYDAFGNRVKRAIVIEPNNKATKSSTGSEDIFYDMVGDRNLKLTHLSSGLLRLDIPDLAKEDECHMEIVSINGTVIMSDIPTEISTIVDIRNHPSGVYILSVRINNNLTTWKIIRK